jgi:DNA-binding IclR family transcriptional regulator
MTGELLPDPAHSGYIVSRTMRVLELTAEGHITVTSVADELDVHPRTARRILRRLVFDGYLAKGPPRKQGGRYTATDKLRELGRRLSESH